MGKISSKGPGVPQLNPTRALGRPYKSHSELSRQGNGSVPLDQLVFS